MNDQFKTLSVADALSIVEARAPLIEAIGVTDYFSTSNFRLVFSEWRQRADSSIALLFPNVEIRLDIPTLTGHGINLHLMCDAEQVDELDSFLALLEFEYQGKRYPLAQDSLMKLGRAYANDSGIDELTAIREGTNQFKVNFRQLKERFEGSSWAKAHCLVAVSGNTGDGTPGLRDGDNSLNALRQQIESFAHIMFSGNPKQRDFWLGNGVDSLEELGRKYSGRKLCLHGSDSHKRSELGSPEKDRFCWVKGDPTFESLKQACIEPEARAAIGALSPANARNAGRIKSLSMQTSGWFDEKPLPINPGLVAIIGARGSGKTALADLIASGAGSHAPFENKESFVRRAGDLLADSAATIGWTDGEPTTCNFGSSRLDDESDPPPVRYLSQQFVSNLCASDGVSEELIQEIERVVFSTWPIDDRLRTTTFAELLAVRLSAARNRQQEETAAITELSESITTLRLTQDVLPAKATELEELKKRLDKAEKEVKNITDASDPGSAKRLQEITLAYDQRSVQLQAALRRELALKTLISEIETARQSTFKRITVSLLDKSLDAELPWSSVPLFEIDFKGDVDAEVRRLVVVATAEAQGIRSRTTVVSPIAEAPFDQLMSFSVEALQVERDRLLKLTGLDQQRSKRLIELNGQIAATRAKSNQLDREILDGQSCGERIAELTEARGKRYAAYFDALLEEEAELNSLYAPLSRILTEAGSSVAKLHFSVKRSVDLDGWATMGERLLDTRIEGSLRGRGELAKAARSSDLVQAWTTGDGVTAMSAIKTFAADHSGDIRKRAKIDRSDLANYRQWERSISEWLYSASHVRLRYTLEYDGVDIQRLSPGTRGIVLLLLYLAVDNEETVPLIIDQPEENLDPESVYSELVRLFRRAAERRQVIMVTHNANLVVNTEVDQVIVASCGPLEGNQLPELRYTSGGLEDPEIRAAVCQILEGGEVAFRERARRLRVTLG